MSNYDHGISTKLLATNVAVPIKSDGCIQCVVGTAPVNLAKDPYDTVNRPFMFANKSAAAAGLGYSTDFNNYTLCQSMYASFDVFAVSPIVMINVLDPQKHVKAELSKTYEVTNKKVRIGETGILLDKLKIESAGEPRTVYEAEEDYVASFNSDGTVTVALISTAAAAETSLKATYVSYHTTYCNALNMWIAGCQTAEEVQQIFYGADVPDEYRSEVLNAYLIQITDVGWGKSENEETV